MRDSERRRPACLKSGQVGWTTRGNSLVISNTGFLSGQTPVTGRDSTDSDGVGVSSRSALVLSLTGVKMGKGRAR